MRTLAVSRFHQAAVANVFGRDLEAVIELAAEQMAAMTAAMQAMTQALGALPATAKA